MNIEYIADFFDGEGSIMIRTSPPKIRSHNLNPTHYLRVQIANTNLDVLKKIQRATDGGSLSRQHRHPNSKTVYALSFVGEKASRLLKSLIPFLLVKRERALFALDFQKNKGDFKGRIIPKEVLALREDYRKRLKKLNERGL